MKLRNVKKPVFNSTFTKVKPDFSFRVIKSIDWFRETDFEFHIRISNRSRPKTLKCRLSRLLQGSY